MVSVSLIQKFWLKVKAFHSQYLEYCRYLPHYYNKHILKIFFSPENFYFNEHKMSKYKVYIKILCFYFIVGYNTSGWIGPAVVNNQNSSNMAVPPSLLANAQYVWVNTTYPGQTVYCRYEIGTGLNLVILIPTVNGYTSNPF